ncbi:hypothetical protein ACFVH0_36000 [Streptomyces sp. NPDC127117]|uniref:hypothetical protein n=1 Tax=Streptomyces sp. NPDC127117 TaxID=3345368 RepID=UPI00362A8363
MASPWATANDLRAHLRLDTIDEPAAERAIKEAEEVIRGSLRQTIDEVVGDVVHLVGAGHRILNLPEMPVTAVTLVKVDGQVLAQGTDYRWNRYGTLTRLNGCWPLDADIEVTHTHGYNSVPPLLVQVCLQVAGRAWVNPKEAISSESLGDYSVSYDKDRTGQALTEFETRILEPYARGPASR